MQMLSFSNILFILIDFECIISKIFEQLDITVVFLCSYCPPYVSEDKTKQKKLTAVIENNKRLF